MNQVKYEPTKQPLKGKLRYSHQEGLALTYDNDHSSTNSLKISELIFGKTLSLWFDRENGMLLYVDGYCPIDSWTIEALKTPSFQPGKVFVVEDEETPHGVAQLLDGLEDEEFVFDKNTGWGRIGSGDIQKNIEIANDIVVGIKENKIVTLWLHPEVNTNDVGEKRKNWWHKFSKQDRKS